MVRLLVLWRPTRSLVKDLGLKHFGAWTKEIGQTIRYSIAGSVFLTVIAILYRSKLVVWINAHPERQLQGTRLAAATITAGAILGVLVTISSIGAGAIGATILVLLYPKMPAAHVAGTDIAYAVPLTAIAVWSLVSRFHRLVLLGSLLIGSLPGITFRLASGKSGNRKLCAGILATTSLSWLASW